MATVALDAAGDAKTGGFRESGTAPAAALVTAAAEEAHDEDRDKRT